MNEEELLKKRWKEQENLKPTKYYSENYVEELQERIDNAIKYIENNSSQSELNIYGIPKCLIFKGSVENLLEILKGEDKE